VVGTGNARVQVTADMDFNRVSETTEHFDPEGRVVRSTSSTESTAATNERPQGATTGANVPDATAASSGSASQNNNNSSQETINYEISHTTTTRVSDGGAINRLSVAVAVDGVSTPPTNGHGQPTWAPRSPEELARLTTLVRSAVGFNQQRGDAVEVVNMRFARAPSEGTEAAAPGPLNLAGLDLTRIIEIVASLIAALAFVFFVLRPLIGGLIRGGANAGQAALPAPNGVAPVGALPPPDGIGGDSGIDVEQLQVRQSSVKKMAEVVNQHPDESVQIIRGWLNNAM